jgi:hypothetical protein
MSETPAPYTTTQDEDDAIAMFVACASPQTMDRLLNECLFDGHNPAPFSADIASAMLVVEKLKQEWEVGRRVDGGGRMWWQFQDCGPNWSAEILYDMYDDGHPQPEAYATEPTLARAVCRVALLHIHPEVEDVAV